MNKFFNNSPILFVAGVFGVLLIFSILLHDENQQDISANPVNKFYRVLPNKYVEALNRDRIASPSDSIFKLIELNEGNGRELVVIKASPEVIELNSEFQVQIYPKDKSKLNKNTLCYNYTIAKKAVIYRHNNHKIAFFKMELPFFEIEQIIVKQLNNNKTKAWSDTLVFPLDKMGFSGYEPILDDLVSHKTGVNILQPLLTHLLRTSDISYDRQLNIKKLKNNSQPESKGANTLIKVFNNERFWTEINERSNNILSYVKTTGSAKAEVDSLFNKYVSGKINFNTLFDIQKLAKYYAIHSLLTYECSETELYFKYNLENNNIEPYFSDAKCIGGKTLKPITQSQISSPLFIREYIKALNNISNINFEELLSSNEGIFKEIIEINYNDHHQIFSYDYLEINQLKIKKALHQSTVIKPELISIDSDELIVSILNTSYFPVEIIGLNYKKNREIINLNSLKQISVGNRDTIVMTLPKSFQNLFVGKKSKKVGFKFYKHIYDLMIRYKTVELDQNYVEHIIPYQEKTVIGEDLFRDKKFVNNHGDILIDKKNKVISFKKDSVTISEPLLIPRGFIFRLKAGTKINITDGGKIVSYAPLKFEGTKNSPVEVFSSDKKGQGIIVLSAEEESNLNHVVFDNLTNLKHGNWNVSGAVTFYESPVNLNYVTVSNNSCEDALNIVRTTFEMKNCIISNTQSDAFDGDFVTGTISNSKFEKLGNDAIDVSGSQLKISNVTIIDAGDKGLSAGENSKMDINNITITLSEIAIAGKDLSIINGKNIQIKNTKLGFTAFQKKPEFGSSQITINNIKMDSIETKYLIESTSSLTVDGVKIETSQNVKDRMYGVEFGVSSTETRKKQ